MTIDTAPTPSFHVQLLKPPSGLCKLYSASFSRLKLELPHFQKLAEFPPGILRQVTAQGATHGVVGVEWFEGLIDELTSSTTQATHVGFFDIPPEIPPLDAGIG
jgi:hypothetical protein